MKTQTIATNWVIDPTHSEVQFKVKHLMVSTVTGSFTRFERQLEVPRRSDSEIDLPDNDFEGASIRFSADVASINTGNAQRDGHLQSAEFFDATQFPTLTFQSTSITTTTSTNIYLIQGHLTMHGVTKPVTLKAEYGGQAQDYHGHTKAGFEVSGVLKRKEFGLNWDGVTEAGGVLVSDEVKLNLNIQVTKQAQALGGVDSIYK